MDQEEFDFGDFESNEAPYQAHSDTSREAAEAIEPDISTLRGQVLERIRVCGEHGATDEELQMDLNMNPSTERPRRIELVRMDLVANSGATRFTRSGRKATVWISTKENKS